MSIGFLKFVAITMNIIILMCMFATTYDDVATRKINTDKFMAFVLLCFHSLVDIFVIFRM